MKKNLNLFVLTIIFLFIIVSMSFSQLRVAVLPFQNMDGNLENNAWSFRLQDSVSTLLMELQHESLGFIVVPPDSVEEALAEYNLDPMSPEFDSDMWKAINDLNIDKVISGSFVLVSSTRFVVNAYVYDVALKLPDPDHQAHNLSRPEKRLYEVVPIIVKQLKHALIAN